MEKKLLRLVIALILGIIISTRSSAKVIGSVGLLCENKNKFAFVEYNEDGLKKITNSSKTFCGIKLVGGIKTNFLYTSIFFGGILKIGQEIKFNNEDTTNKPKIDSEIDFTDKININKNINNKNNNFLEKSFYVISKIPKIFAYIWSMYGTWNNINVIFKYLGNIMLRGLNIDFKGVL